MSGFKEPGFADRQKAALQAKQNLLNKFRSQPGPDDPEVAKRRAEREAIAAKREQLRLEREAAKAEQARLEAEAAAAETARIAREREEEAQRQAALEAEQKAKRDARYAARKSKGKKR
jgi:capsule polysaccharide export protein KpsE/RkpR